MKPPWRIGRGGGPTIRVRLGAALALALLPVLILGAVQSTLTFQREARERQGLGYPEIELATKIRAKYIRALEEEDFTAIPGDAYIRGFLRTYAEYLGLDGDVYVDEYASRFITSWRDELPPRPERRRIRTGERARTVDCESLLGGAAWRQSVRPPTQQSGRHERSLQRAIFELRHL